MYCHTCGAQLAQALSYCNHCGTSLSALKVQGQGGAEETIDTLIWVIVGSAITLLGMALGALVLMKNGAIDDRLGRAFVILTFVALLVSEGVLVWRLLHLKRDSQEMRALPQANDPRSEKTGAVTARALHEPLEPVSSVTEEPTRVFEPLFDKSERR